MIIDIHNHPDYHGYSAKAIVENMDKYGIDITCLISWECPATDFDPLSKINFSPFSEMAVPFKSCIEYKNYAPDRFLLGYIPDPRDPFAIQKLRAIDSLCDLSLAGELKLRMMYDNPDAIRLYKVCGELGLPVLMHFDYEIPVNGKFPWPNYWYGGGIDVLERVLALCPETKFLGHAPGFWAHISNDDKAFTQPYPKGDVIPGGRIEQLLEKYPNLYCDISAGSGHNALRRDKEFTERFLTKWQDRVLFARDYFDNVHQDLLMELNISDEVRYKIFEGNARKILKNGDKIPTSRK